MAALAVVTKEMHWIPGRLRIRISGLRNNPVLATGLLQSLSSLDGVNGILPNIVTGKLLIHYDPTILTLHRLLAEIQENTRASMQARLPRLPESVSPPAKGKVLPVIEPEDTPLKSQWLHVVGGGSLLSYLFLKRIFWGRPSWADNPALLHLATATTLISGYPILRSGLGSLTRGKISHDLLISMTAYATLLLRENIFGLATVWAVNLISLLQTLAVLKSRQHLESNSDLSRILVQQEWSQEMIPASQVTPGELIRVQAGELIPFQARVHSGTGLINETPTTGKTLHRLVKENDVVEPGNLVEAGRLSLEVRKIPAPSPVKICLGQGHLRQDRFMDHFVNLSFALAFFSFLLTKDIQRSLTMLLAAIPASYSLATPSALCSAVRYQVKRGVQVLNPEQLLKAEQIDTVLFDKTGTLTTGEWEVSQVLPLDDNWTKETILVKASRIRSGAGYGKRDPLASLLTAGKSGPLLLKDTRLHASGIRCQAGDQSILLGTPAYMATRGISLKKYQPQIKSLQASGTTVIALVINRVPVGIIGFEESIRPESYLLIKELKQMGITRLGILSGDTQDACLNVARKLGISQVWGSLHEQEKAQVVREFRHLGCHVCVVGDGMNDRAALREADVAIGLKNPQYLTPVTEAGIILPEHALDQVADLVSFGAEVSNCAKNNKFLAGCLDVVGLTLACANLLTPVLSTLMANISIFGVILNSSLVKFTEKRSIQASSPHLSRVYRWSLDKSLAGRKKGALISPAMKNFVQPVKPWHALTAEETIHELHSHLNQGLTCDQTPGMLDTLGPNQFYQPPPASLLARFFSQLKDFMIQLLLGASIVSFVLGERVDAVTILGIVCLESFIGMIQEHHAEQALAALKELAAPVARVTREGKNLLIPAREIVPGDLILLEPGDRVPADARLIEGSSLEVEEAALTGESLSVAKEGNRSLPEETAVADRNNMVFMGTHVTGGRAKATVVNTGMSTEMGRIAALLENTEEESTPLQKYLDQLGKQITSGCLAVCACMVIMGCLRGQSRFHMLRTGISLAVGAIPEGLPAVVTIALAFGVGRMVKGNAIIRRLPAVENLGNTQVICTDKTGTLTKNEMTVKQVYSSGKTWHVTGSGYTPEGEFFLDGEKMIPSADPNLLGILTIGALCNNAKMEKSGIAGDPTDCAVLVAAAKAGIGPETAGAFLRRKEAPFDATRKAMSVVCQDREGKLALYVKGAPEAILEKCTKSFQDGRLELLTPEKKKEISAAGESMADNALRVIATAYKTIRPSGINEDPSVLEENLIFSGLLGMEDPPKQGVVEAVAACHEAGIKVIMVTGDHVHTGEAIARQIGLLTPVGKSLTGNQLDHLDDKDLAAMIDEVEIFARTSPEHKLRIVKAFKSKGYIVAMTGDGVNDAPAVKEADIGIAMGRSGTDVTSASADVVLTDDNFPTIVLAIKEGRGIKENIRTSIRYVLAGNFGEVLAMFLAVLAGQPVPLIPNQILWVNLVTESFPALALGGAPPGSHFIPANRRFMDRHQWRGLFLRGLLAGAATYGIFAFSLRSGASLVKARTLGFASLILNQMFHAFDCNAASGQKKHPRELFMAVGLSTALMLGAIYFPGCGPVFSTVPLRGTDWLMVLLSAGVLGRLDLVLRHLSLPPATKT